MSSINIFTKLKDIIPFKFRIGSKVWNKYLVLGYIDARDVMDRLDEVVTPMNWSRDDYSVDWKKHCKVWIKIEWEWTYKSDVWAETTIAKEKWEASDAFKRACVNWWIWRFLYTLPKITITEEEEEKHKYKVTEFVKEKYKWQLLKWMEKHWKKMDDLVSKYEEYEEYASSLKDVDISEATIWFTSPNNNE